MEAFKNFLHRGGSFAFDWRIKTKHFDPSDFVIIEASSFRRGKFKIKIFLPFI